MEDASQTLTFLPSQKLIRGACYGAATRSHEIAWNGGRAVAKFVKKMQYEADQVPDRLVLVFAFNATVSVGECRSFGKVKGGNTPRAAFVLPAGLDVGWRIKQVEDEDTLVLGLEHEFIARSAGLEHHASFQIADSWYHDDPLHWQLGRAIYDECMANSPRGLLFIESAATLLALHTLRSLSGHRLPKQLSHRGGLPSGALRRVCEYMVSRLEEDHSLHELANIAALSPGHFSVAFKTSVGLSPFAWLRRQRVERIKTLLLDPSLELQTIARLSGYANLSALGVAFKRETGVTPTQWKRSRS